MEYQMEHSNECKKNFVAVYDGSSAIENLKAKFCSTVANDVMLDNGVGVVRMWADEKSRLSRFRMLFTSFVDRECQPCWQHNSVWTPFFPSFSIISVKLCHVDVLPWRYLFHSWHSFTGLTLCCCLALNCSLFSAALSSLTSLQQQEELHFLSASLVLKWSVWPVLHSKLIIMKKKEGKIRHRSKVLQFCLFFYPNAPSDRGSSDSTPLLLFGLNVFRSMEITEKQNSISSPCLCNSLLWTTTKGTICHYFTVTATTLSTHTQKQTQKQLIYEALHSGCITSH